MDQLQRSADKLLADSKHLSHMLGCDPSPEQVDLALSVAKRVRRESTMMVRLLASLRDSATA